MNYKHILFSVDLGPQSLYIGKRALDLANLFNAQITCLHIIEPPMSYTLEFSERDKHIHQATNQAQKSLNALISKLSNTEPKIAPQPQPLIRIGSPQNEILEAGLKVNCDLIVIGSHGIGGYTHLLGSTAHHVLSYAHCDVLIVQVSPLEKFIREEPSQHYLWENQPITLPESQTKRFEGPPHGGSKLGFGENISRGPRLVNRPGGYPYKGGHRQTDDSDNDQDNNV